MDFIIGKVEEIESNYIGLNNNNIGYLIYTANPYSFELNKEYKIYVYQYIKEDEISLYGFKEKEERNLFLKLISVKGLGCKMALPMIATGSTKCIIDAIDNENILYLKKFPKIGDKLAKQIILDLKGKLSNTCISDKDELIQTLKSLGYKQSDISKILPQIKSSTIEEQIKESLRLFLK